MRISAVCRALVLGYALVTHAHAQIARCLPDSACDVVPGTSNITLGPGVQLDHMDLAFALFFDNDLTGANFASANLTGAGFHGTTLSAANFTDAVVTGTRFEDTTDGGFSQEQLSSTANYQQGNQGQRAL